MDATIGMQQSSIMLDNKKFENTVSAMKSLNTAKKTSTDEDEKQKLLETAKEFESLFMNEMMKAMRKTVDHSGLLGKKSQSEEVFTSMLDNEYSKIASNQGSGMGLAQLMVQQLESKQNLPVKQLNDYLRNVKTESLDDGKQQ
ncbi:MAG: rod-binding protein [Nitrospinae bacterium]|nr:rod-binding protein [Nitrospinota bacterium]